MSKKAKVWTIIGNVLITLLLAYFLLAFVTTLLELWEKNNFKKSLKKYGQESKLIYSDYKDIYYHNQKYDFEYEILWIDDTNIIYQNEGMYYICNNDYTKELILSDIDRITYGSLFARNNCIYFKSDDSNYCYNVDDDSLITISRKEYLEKRDGNKYNIDTVFADNKINISITDRENNLTRIIDLKKICKIKSVSYIIHKYYGRLFNYYIINNQIYLCLYGGSYSLILRYDFENDKIEIYDWFYRETSRICYLVFEVNDIKNVPMLKKSE